MSDRGGSLVGRTGAERCTVPLPVTGSPARCHLCPTLPPGATTAPPSREALSLGVTAWDGARSSAAIPPHPSPAHTGPGPGQPPPGALPRRTGPVSAAGRGGRLSAARDGDRRRRGSEQRAARAGPAADTLSARPRSRVSAQGSARLAPGSGGPLAARWRLLTLGVGGARASPLAEAGSHLSPSLGAPMPEDLTWGPPVL